MRRPLRLAAVAAVAAVAVAAGCADEGRTTEAASTTAGWQPAPTTTRDLEAALDGPLPPLHALDALPLFEEEFEELGVRLTARGGLIDVSGGRYEQSARGTHYALYVEPVDPGYDIDRYVANLVPLAQATAPVLFERYPELESYDICQEPAAAPDDSGAEPPAVTQVALTREQADDVDWGALDLAGLLDLRESGATVFLSPEVDAAVTRRLAATGG